VARLEKANETLEASQSPMNSVLGNLGSSLVEAFIKRNPKIMASIPGGSALAGLIDESVPGQPAEDVEVSFKPKNNEDHSKSEGISKADQDAIAFVNQIKEAFNAEEFGKISLIHQSLASDKNRFSVVLRALNIQTN
jgi:hypothetical protein